MLGGTSTTQRAAVAVMALAVAVSGATVRWTGYGGNNQWATALNWDTNTVPTANDDVTIGSGVVEVTVASAVYSLTMGTEIAAPANVTIFQTLVIGNGGMSVAQNGVLVLPAGTSSVSGVVSLGGMLVLTGGTISGQWTVSKSGSVQMIGGGKKTLSGCGLTSAGENRVTGLVSLAQGSQMTISSVLVVSGDAIFQADKSAGVLLDTSAGVLSYLGGGTMQLMVPTSLGKLDWASGNITVLTDVAFVQPVVIPSKSVLESLGSAVVTLKAGASGDGAIVASGANLTFEGPSNVSMVRAASGNVTIAVPVSVGVLSVAGGVVMARSKVTAGRAELSNGRVSGGKVAIEAGVLVLVSAGFDLEAGVTATRGATLGGVVSLNGDGAVTLGPECVASSTSPVSFSGAQGATVTNDGSWSVSGSATFSPVGLAGTGTLKAFGTVAFQGSSLGQGEVQLSGAGGVLKGSVTQIVKIGSIVGTQSVLGQIGDYRFECATYCANVTTSWQPTTNFRFSLP